MSVIIGGKDLAAIYTAGVMAHGDGRKEVERFRDMCRKVTGEEPEYGDSLEFNLGRINEQFDVPPFR